MRRLYVLLDSSTGLCKTWPDGEYYDFTTQQWRDWVGVWTGFWRYQSSCIQWLASEALDLETLTCVPDSSCDIVDSPFNSGASHYTISKFWKRTSFYVDPTSSKLLELGTKDYPYRTIQPVFAEILNEFSHSSESLNVYVKEETTVFIDDSTIFIINITEVAITTYTDSGSDPTSATLVTTEDPQTHISERAVLHLLSDTSLDLADVIAAGNFTSTELGTLGRSGDTFHISRSSLTISNFIVNRYAVTDSGFFLYLSYLQSRKLTMGNEFWIIL